MITRPENIVTPYVANAILGTKNTFISVFFFFHNLGYNLHLILSLMNQNRVKHLIIPFNFKKFMSLFM